MNRKIAILNSMTVCLTAVFGLLQFTLHFDVSLWAIVLMVVFTVPYAQVAFVLFARRHETRAVAPLRLFLEYVPFVSILAFVVRRAGEFATPGWYDALAVWLWIALLVCSRVTIFFLGEKRVRKNCPDMAADLDAIAAKKPGIGKKILIEIFGWVDALVWAAFFMAIVNVFVFQLYEIPSESMVPEILVKDRVVVFKTPYNPKFPLSQIGVPTHKGFKRGDIVVLRNPHYGYDRKYEVRSFLSQIVYTCTLGTVNLNTVGGDAMRADPLVKRVTGVPGEQLMMQDGVLYRRTADDLDWRVVEEDASWACWNLVGLPAETRSKVHDFIISQSQYDAMLEVESERNGLNYGMAAIECRELAQRFTVMRNRMNPNLRLGFGAALPELFTQNEMTVFNLFRNIDAVTLKLSTVQGGAEWFTEFVTDWINERECLVVGDEDLVNGNLYDESMYRLNVMLKRVFAQIVVRNMELNLDGVGASERQDDALRQNAFVVAEKLNLYVQLMNQRNMPVFPANNDDGSPRFIPDDHYFMMGDNRFNSLDMRHSYDEWLAPLSAQAASGFQYYTNVDPQYVSIQRLLGKPVLRFWPFSRFGVPGR